jgi:adenine-specific DNA methylase
VNDRRRLIEVAFPLKQASIDSVHEKNVRHGHISTLHIWPARRPLAASRAALITTLLCDPGNDMERKRILERLAGKVVSTTKRKKLAGRIEETHSEETAGGILHWGLESGPDLQWFRDEIRKAYGGRAPRVFDPFAGGGAIPLEAMRLGCEVTAGDINPVAWMILRCTLEYPQRLAGRRRPLPEFVRRDRGFMERFLKAQGLKSAAVRTQLERLGFGGKGEQAFGEFFRGDDLLNADFAWHVRSWGTWVLAHARQALQTFYPTIGGKPTVGYLWARTVSCKGCRATLPLLKTRWLCKKDSKRVLLTMRPNEDESGVVFGVESGVAFQGGNAAQRREHDKRIGAGTMSRSGATCPCCHTTMTMSDLRLEGASGRLSAAMTAVVVDGADGKEYRLPQVSETDAATAAKNEIERMFSEIPFGVPEEPTPKGGTGASRAFSVDGYGLDRWYKLFTPRQLCALGAFVRALRAARSAAQEAGYEPEWVEAIVACISLMVDRLANQSSTLARWNQGGENIEGTFARFALPMLWDFAEVNPLGETSGGFPSAFEWVSLALDHFTSAVSAAPNPHVVLGSAAQPAPGQFDLVLTDPPYYDAIPYSDLMDFFYVWLRRSLFGLSPAIDAAFREPLGPKWDESKNDGELIDDSSRFAGDAGRSRATYEDGMARSFLQAQRSLSDEGRLVIVFAHKQPDAWETLVSAIIRAGFVVDGSWPIQTERAARTRSLSSAALSSSVWLVCRKRPEVARPGWDNRVLDEMRERIKGRLREFWDAGIRGPDVVWAATGPALEAYSQHPVVKKADEPGQVMSVSEFLRHVRRMVVDFVVGRVLSHDGQEEEVTGLDDVTTYYLLHRHDFGMADAPIGPCILYAVSCGLSDGDLVGTHDLLARKGQVASAEDEEGENEDDQEAPSGGSMVRLKPWTQRLKKSLGYEGPAGRLPPLVDQIHRLMHLWKAGDVNAVNAYLDDRELRYSPLFPHLLQALVELSEKEERSILESLANHVRSLGTRIPSTRELPLR